MTVNEYSEPADSRPTGLSVLPTIEEMEDKDLAPEERESIQRGLRALANHVWRLGRTRTKSKSHPAWLRAIGQFWKECREDATASRADVANRVGMPEDELALFEAGLLDPADLPATFPSDLAAAIGDPDALSRYYGIFEQPRRRRARRASRRSVD
jgi:hypothetical protein